MRSTKKIIKGRRGNGRRRPMTEKKKILSVEIEKKDNSDLFLVTVKKEKQREMTPEALRFSSLYYKFLSQEDKKRVVDSLTACAGGRRKVKP